ncbi:MAG: type II secretion system major pseudopilin GspG [Thiotrichaceae bacterium]|nr:type II secretion system major pseudopilin GspG [Thiotrichaceae bacterium]
MKISRDNRRKAVRGFTLIEVLVVIVILGILASFVVPNIMNKPGQAKITKAKSDVRAIESALNMYKLENHDYPGTDEGLEALVGNELPRLPTDPWDNAYFYLYPGENGAIDVYSLGRDGAQGGEGEDADVGNWNLSGN